MYGMSRLSVCLAALLLCCAGPSPAAGSSAPAGPALTGMVLSPAGQPLPGVRVELRPVLSGYTQSLLSLEDPEEPSAVAVATTDAAGRYALRAPETGIWRVTVRSPGMVTLHFPVLPLAGPRELPPAPLTADAGAPLLLTDQAGKPLAGAWIAASASGQPAGGIFPADWRPAPQVGRTDGRGSLSLERRDGETLEVSVFLPGRAETVRSGFTGGSLQIPAGGETARDLRVVSRSGEPIPDTAVRIGPRAWPAGRADAQGRLRLPLPASGSAALLLLTRDGRQATVQVPAPSPGGQETSFTLPLPLTLAGRIVDSQGRKPVTGALVWASADPGAFVRTDAGGRFRLTVPTRRRFEAEVLAAGFLPRKVAIPGPQLAGGQALTVALDRAGALRGQVVDPQARPLAGVLITAVPAAARGDRALDPSDPVAERTVSDAQGRFELRLLRPAQDYEVRARRNGSFPTARTATVGDPAEPPHRLTLVLAPARGARGRVQDPEGRPVAGAEVTLRPALRPGAPRALPLSGEAPAAEPEAPTVRSDETGAFTLTACPAAEIELTVRRAGFAPALLPALRLPAGAGPADLGTIVLRPGVPLTSRVVGPNGRPAGGAEVFALRDPVDVNGVGRVLGKRKPAATAGTDGRFTIQDLSPGTPIHLAVRAAGYLTARVRAVRPPLAAPLVIRLEPENLLAGRVVDGQGEPVAGARLELRWQAILPEDPDIRLGDPVLQSARSEADGRFTLRGIPAGGSLLGVSAQGFVAREGIEVDLPRPAAAGELRLELDRGALLQGRVSTTAGDPVPAVHVALGGASASTDDDGLYWLEGAKLGRQEVLFFHPSRGRIQKDFDIQPGVNMLDISLDPGVEVTGRAVDDRGRPLSGARIELASWDRFELRRLQDVTGEDGRFRLAPVPPGRYRLSAAAEGFADTELPQPVTVAAEPPPPLDIALSRGATVSGRILGLSPEDLAQVEVTAAADTGAEAAVWTDGRGRYEAGPLTPGDWTLSAILWSGQRRARARLAVGASDREIVRDLEFEKRLTLTAQVLADGEPLPDARVSLRGRNVAADRTALTDYDGRVRIDDLEPDTYSVGVSQTQKLLIHNDQVDLREDRDLVIRFETATLDGRVASAADGAPVADAAVSLRPLEGPDYMVSTGTKDDGRFAMYHVQPGRYRLEARAQGFTAASQEIQLAGGQEVDGIDISLEPAAGAKLRVRLASGEVPGLVHVLARDASGVTVLADTRPADTTGTIDLASLPAGAWTLFAAAEGGAVTGTPLVVPADPLSLTLPPAGRLLVRVSALLASGLQGTVRLLTADQQPFWTLGPGGSIVTAWPLLDGKALLDGVPAGTWLLQVETPDGQRWNGMAVTAGTAETAVTIE